METRVPRSKAVVGADSSEHPLSQALSGLTPGTTYHYRIVASDCEGCASGTTYGADATFTTQSPVTPASVASIPAATSPPEPSRADPAVDRSALAGTHGHRRNDLGRRARFDCRAAPAKCRSARAQNIPIGSVIDAQQRRGRTDDRRQRPRQASKRHAVARIIRCRAEPRHRHDDVHASASARLRVATCRQVSCKGSALGGVAGPVGQGQSRSVQHARSEQRRYRARHLLGDDQSLRRNAHGGQTGACQRP